MAVVARVARLGCRVVTDAPSDGTQRWIELAFPRAETKLVLFSPARPGAWGRGRRVGDRRRRLGRWSPMSRLMPPPGPVDADVPSPPAASLAAPDDPLRVRAHRPWPLPRRPWMLAMRWSELAFLHWPIRPAAIAARLPPSLVVDTWDGWAWLAVVPFVMQGVRWRGLPPLPGARDFPELNLRTYVRTRDGARAGVWFFSLDCASALAVRGARAGFGLPYFDARMSVAREGDAVAYASRRVHRGAPAAAFAARYRPTGPAAAPTPGTFAHWLVERYALFARPPLRALALGEVHHAPWPLQPAECEVRVDTLAHAAGLAPDRRPPVVHYAATLAVRAWLPRALGRG